MAEALTAAAEILEAGWTFISGNPVLYGITVVGLFGTAIYKIKSFVA